MSAISVLENAVVSLLSESPANLIRQVYINPKLVGPTLRKSRVPHEAFANHDGISNAPRQKPLGLLSRSHHSNDADSDTRSLHGQRYLF